MKVIRVQIDAVDDEGRGRGNYSDETGHDYDVAVRGAFIGDDVQVEVERVFAAHALLVGRATQFFTKSDCHTTRTCPHEGPCPACPLHGVEPSLSIDIKRARIAEALDSERIDRHCERSEAIQDSDNQKHGLLRYARNDEPFDGIVFDDVVNHPQQFGYRQKVKLMAEVKDNQLRLGVYIPYSHRFVVAEQCPYVHPKINEAITKLLALLNALSVRELAPIKAIILRAGKDGVAAVIVTRQPLSDAVMGALIQSTESGILLCIVERVQSHETNSILSGELGRQIGPSLIESLEGGPLVDPDSFCQSDPEQAAFMYDLVAQFLTAETRQGLFLDGYAGVGGFSRALLRCGVGEKLVIAIEQSQSALVSLCELSVQVILSPMHEALQSLSEKSFTAIVVDPPKKGLMDDAHAIASLKAQRVALVSCDPDAMAKDLRVFLEHGYKVERIIPIDFFGGTPAIETVVLMQKAFL